MTPEELKLLVKVPVSTLESVTGLQDGELLFYDTTTPENKLKKISIDVFNNLSKTAKPLKPTDPTPTEEGLYMPTESGTYSNIGGLEAKDGYYTLFFFDGSVWTKSETKLPENNGEPFNSSISENIIGKYKDSYYIDSSNGNEVPLAGYSVGYGTIKPNTQYTPSHSFFTVAFYDIDHQFISANDTPNTFTSPSSAYYIKVGIDSNFKAYYTVGSGSKKTILSKNIIGSENAGIKAVNIADVDLLGIDRILSNLDLFDKTKILRNTYIDFETGNILRIGDDNYYSSRPIRVEGGVNYEFGNIDSQQYAFYDNAGVFISGYAPDVSSKIILSPKNAYYICFTGSYSSIQNQHLVKSKSNNLFGSWANINNKYVSYADGGVYPVSDMNTTQFITVKPNTTYEFGDIKNQQLAWYDSNYNFISGMAGSISGFEKVITSPNNAFFIRFNTHPNDLQSQYFREIQPNDDIKKVFITVSKNAENWNSVRNVIQGVKDASYWKRYYITVPVGTWNECDWGASNEFIEIKGEDRYKTVIVSDGTDTNPNHIVPFDYMGYGNYSGEQYSTIPQDYRHLVFVRGNVRIYNMTLKAKSCKYVIHADDKRFNNYEVSNCNLEDLGGCNFVLGIGTWDSQNCKIKYSKIIRPIGSNASGVLLHNSKGEVKDTFYHFYGCSFINCDYLYLDELESDVSDVVILENCKGGGTIRFGVNNESGVTPLSNAKYNLQLIVVNTAVSSYLQQNRPDYEIYNQL